MANLFFVKTVAKKVENILLWEDFNSVTGKTDWDNKEDFSTKYDRKLVT